MVISRKKLIETSNNVYTTDIWICSYHLQFVWGFLIISDVTVKETLKNTNSRTNLIQYKIKITGNYNLPRVDCEWQTCKEMIKFFKMHFKIADIAPLTVILVMYMVVKDIPPC